MKNDGDGYFGVSKQSSTSPGALWKASKGAGSDCNDNDATKTNNCSTSTPAPEPTMKGWFLDKDGDGYHGVAQGATTSPGSEWTNSTKGSDCDDTNASKTTDCGTQTPTTPPATPPDLCDKLKKLSENIKYKAKLAEIIEKAKTDNTKEYGYCIAKGASDYEAGTNDSDGDLDFPNDSQLYGIIHDHTSPRRTIGPDNFPKRTKYIQMFSREDLRTFVMMLNNTAANGAAIADVFSTFSDKNGNVYTLKYEGTYDDIKGKNIDVAGLAVAYATNLNRAGISNYGGIENAFVAFLQLDVKIPGIVLYKTTPGTTPTKLGITSDGTKISASNTPCK